MKHPIRLLLCLFSLYWLGQPATAQVPSPPEINARSYILYDYASEQVLAEKNADERVAPASITKVLTSYIVFDEIRQKRLSPDDKVLISERAWRQGIDSSESRMFLEVGSQVRLEDLLRGIIVQSGNDASIAIAEHIAGSESAFAGLMNDYAKRLGMHNSHFTDASGLPHPEHYTTARDLAILARALIHDFPEWYPLFAEREFTWNKIRQINRNLLLNRDPSIDGIKTGHTSEAGYCLLSSAQRDGRRLIAAVMGAPSWAYREQATLELLNYGFRVFETASLLGPDKPAQTVEVYKGAARSVAVGTLKPVSISLVRGSSERVQINTQVNQPLIAPITQGQVVGSATFTLDGKTLKTVPVVALTDVPKGGFLRWLIDTIRLWFGW
ncbi:penicillin-binding protein 6. Serine peptidase. MEROPS family S11 [Fontimonas thermophila]|uniref:serine-type D-Ala-D-Ala carboxypeptidase n=1 Tax=Fontimonas thermophila TaxID=1076937 RepID=A0A1I2IZT4_9GAMM|nr:D-alanyl-D-alanine carboxypeptidase family protein [Fontimonas thermophila]SFF47238.1 penicillin-binding protein 6. Serine peptidase. MEROPS family S11 [Fontimonas thermophila]